MSVSTVVIGTENALGLLEASREHAYNSRTLTSLQDLLDALQENPPTGYAMLRTTASKLTEFYNKSCADILIESVESDRDEFRAYLRELKYASGSVRSYSNYACTLAKTARKLGWTPSPDVIPPEWLPLIAEIHRAGAQRLLRYLVRQGRVPATVQETDLEKWVEREIRRGGSYTYANSHSRVVRKLLVKSGFCAHLSFKRVAKKRYGVALESFPEPLRTEVKEVRHFKQARFVSSRQKDGQIRPVTGERLQHSFSRLFGFAVNVKGMPEITTLRKLMTEEIVTGYVDWALDDRRLGGAGLRTNLAGISAALGHNPKYSSLTASWLPQLVKAIPEDTGEETRHRKEEKYLPYATLGSIPELIRRGRPAASKSTSREMALSIRNELLMQWLVILPWRQLNIRNMRIGGEKPNLFKAPFPRFTSMTKPAWVVEAEKQDPGTEVWQIRFSKGETKTKHEVEAVLPRSLVPLLDEYLSIHRPHLVRRGDPGTLFLNEAGKAMSARTLTDLVAQLTLKYGGRVVTPHLFRDIYAYMWLEKAPEDYLTLSKLLWHRIINTTIQIYGRKFNESAAMCRMEKVLGL